MNSDDEEFRGFSYIRESSARQMFHGYRPEEQREKIETYCKEHRFIIDKEFADAGSGGNILKRPNFVRMIEEVKRRTDIRFIVVDEFSRFFRNLTDTIICEKELNENNVYVLDTINDPSPRSYFSKTGGIDPDQWNVRMSARQGSELERRKTSKRLKETWKQKRGRGHPVGALPFGLKYIDEPRKRFVEYSFPEAYVVKEIFNLYINSTGGFTEIAKILNGRGLVRKMPYREYDPTSEIYQTLYRDEGFTNETVRTALTNKVFIGLQNYSDNFLPLQTKVNGVVQDLEPLISRHDFDLAQSKIKENRRGKSSKNKQTSRQKRVYMLQGIIRSAVNGSEMHGYPEVKDNGEVVRRYVAKSNKRGDDVHVPSIRCEEVEEQVLEMLQGMTINDVESVERALRNMVDREIRVRASKSGYDREGQNKKAVRSLEETIKVLEKNLAKNESISMRAAISELMDQKHDLERASLIDSVDYYDLSELKMFAKNTVRDLKKMQSLSAEKDLVQIMFDAVYVHKMDSKPEEFGLKTLEELENKFRGAKDLKDLLQEYCPKLMEKVLAEKDGYLTKVYFRPTGLFLLLADRDVADYTSPDSGTWKEVDMGTESKKKTFLRC